MIFKQRICTKINYEYLKISKQKIVFNHYTNLMIPYCSYLHLKYIFAFLSYNSQVTWFQLLYIYMVRDKLFEACIMYFH